MEQQYINSVELQGVVGTIRINQVGENKVANLSLSTTYYKRKDGEAVAEVTWHNVCAWNGENVTCIDEIKKGTFLNVKGRIRQSQYIASDGSTRVYSEILAHSVKIING